ncbi:MAG: putative zinc-binding metallopeptidase [Burkholderiaceae bacterium]
MKRFNCGQCGSELFFENTRCLSCGADIGWDWTTLALRVLEPEAATHRRCANVTQPNPCNALIADGDPPGSFCWSCGFTEIAPDLRLDVNRLRLSRLEDAKRRLLTQLRTFGLPVGEQDGSLPLRFRFLVPIEGQEPVITGHANGTITVDALEADDEELHRRKQALDEKYRTVLGHLRHEVGHYYYALLVERGNEVESFRATFGDPEADYAASIERHYAQGPPPNWPQSHVTAYASSHPWEDFAESWAHLLHITDALETAGAYSMSAAGVAMAEQDACSMLDDMEKQLSNWQRLSIVLNALARGIGQPDPYPFALSPTVVGKICWIAALIRAAGLPEAPDPRNFR